jgi:hypothetical protein
MGDFVSEITYMGKVEIHLDNALLMGEHNVRQSDGVLFLCRSKLHHLVIHFRYCNF